MSDPVISQALGFSTDAVGDAVHLRLVVHHEKRLTFVLTPTMAEGLAELLKSAAGRAKSRKKTVDNHLTRHQRGATLTKPSGVIL